MHLEHTVFGVIDKKYAYRQGGRKISFPLGNQLLSLLCQRPDVRESTLGPLKLLVVEGATSNGQVIRDFRDQLSKELEKLDVRYAYLFRNRGVAEEIDFLGEDEPTPWPEELPWHVRDTYRRHMAMLDGHLKGQ